MLDLIPINALSVGQTAKVGHLAGETDQVRRLEEMGMRGGATIEMLSPGKPCIVRLNGHRICFRESELLGIFVEMN